MTEDYCLPECEIGTSSIDRSHLRSFHLKTETEPSLRNVVFLNKNGGVLDENWRTENVQKHNICTNVPSSQTFRY
jgi:hypothetical protein